MKKKLKKIEATKKLEKLSKEKQGVLKGGYVIIEENPII